MTEPTAFDCGIDDDAVGARLRERLRVDEATARAEAGGGEKRRPVRACRMEIFADEQQEVPIVTSESLRLTRRPARPSKTSRASSPGARRGHGDGISPRDDRRRCRGSARDGSRVRSARGRHGCDQVNRVPPLRVYTSPRRARRRAGRAPPPRRSRGAPRCTASGSPHAAPRTVTETGLPTSTSKPAAGDSTHAWEPVPHVTAARAFSRPPVELRPENDAFGSTVRRSRSSGRWRSPTEMRPSRARPPPSRAARPSTSRPGSGRNRPPTSSRCSSPARPGRPSACRSWRTRRARRSGRSRRR